MSIGPYQTGGTSRAPLTLAALRDRLESLEEQLLHQQTNRQSVGPGASQQSVPLHALSNASPMSAVKDGQMPVFDGATGLFSPGGPLFRFGKPLAGDPPPPGPFPWTIATGPYVAASAGGSISVPFVDKDGNPTPFAHGLLGIEVCVGNASPTVMACGIATAGYQLSGVRVDFFSTSGPVADGTGCQVDYTAYGW